MEILTDSYEWILNHIWVAEIALLLLLLTGLNFVLKKALIHSRDKAQKNDWQFHLDLALLSPARALLWVIVLAFTIDLLVRNFELKGIFLYVPHLRNTGIVVCFTWFLLRWKTDVYKAMRTRNLKGKVSFDLTSLEILDKVFTIAVLFLTFLILLSLFHIDILPLVTFGGIGAAALGFASKDVIANFFGGLMLYISRPFSVNDLIELPQKKLTGYIEQIGWYFTSIRDLDKNLIYVPNFFFPTEPVVNLSRMTHRKLDEIITVRHSDVEKIPSLIEAITHALKKNSHIDQYLRTDVHLLKIAHHGLEIEIKAYVSDTRYEEFMQIRQKILLEICHLIEKAGAQKPLLTTTLINGNS